MSSQKALFDNLRHQPIPTNTRYSLHPIRTRALPSHRLSSFSLPRMMSPSRYPNWPNICCARNLSFTLRRPSCPISLLAVGSCSRKDSCWARMGMPLDPTGWSRPVTFSTTISGVPPTSVPSTCRETFTWAGTRNGRQLVGQ